MSSTAALQAGLRGKALRITHHYRDSLWQVFYETKINVLITNLGGSLY